MHKIFVAPDGSWGDAEFIRIIEVTDEEAIDMVEMSDSEIAEFAATKTPIS